MGVSGALGGACAAVILLIVSSRLGVWSVTGSNPATQTDPVLEAYVGAEGFVTYGIAIHVGRPNSLETFPGFTVFFGFTGFKSVAVFFRSREVQGSFSYLFSYL